MGEEKPKQEDKPQDIQQTEPPANPQAEPAAKAPEPAVKEAVKTSRPANCVSCNKSIKKKWYYRNGKYFCTKQCWKSTIKNAKDSVPAP